MKSSGAGLDRILPAKMKAVADDISHVLAHIINTIFKSGVFPSELKRGKIVPVFKKGDRNVLSNYRPITILPFFSKLIEKLIVARLMKYLTKFKLLTQRQFGFRPNYSTELALIELTDFIKQGLDNQLFVGAVFIDLTKAFDTINHNILFLKLESLGICGPALLLIQNYLSNRNQFVKFGHAMSNPTVVNQGVPQGSILGPLLFLMYINDLPTTLNNSKCILYADDTTIFASDHDVPNLTAKLTNDLQKVHDWCRKNLLQINRLKTTFMIFHSPQKQLSAAPCIFLDGNSIHPSDSTNFLGVVLDKNIKFDEHIKSVTSKIAFGIRVLIKTRHFFQLPILRSLYYSFIHSHLTYCLSSWGNTYNSHLAPLHRLQNQAIRLLTFSDYRSAVQPIYHDLGILPLSLQLDLKLSVLMFRMRNNTDVPTFLDKRCLLNTNNTRFSEQLNILLPTVRTNYGKQTLLFAGASVWNSLPPTLKQNPNQHSFQRSMQKFLLGKIL